MAVPTAVMVADVMVAAGHERHVQHREWICQHAVAEHSPEGKDQRRKDGSGQHRRIRRLAQMSFMISLSEA